MSSTKIVKWFTLWNEVNLSKHFLSGSSSSGRVAQVILYRGMTEGLFNPDLMLLLIEPTMYLLIAIAEEYDIERKYRETRLYQIAPVSTNLILAYIAQNILGLKRSY